MYIYVYILYILYIYIIHIIHVYYTCIYTEDTTHGIYIYIYILDVYIQIIMCIEKNLIIINWYIFILINIYM